MEKISKPFSLGRKVLFVVVTGLVIGSAVLLLLDRSTVQVPAVLAPMTNVTITVKDEHASELPPGASRFVVAAALPTTSPVPSPSSSPGATSESAPPPGTPLLAIDLMRASPALTISFPRTWDVVAWADAQPSAHRFFTSRVFLGMAAELVSTLQVRPEDLSISSMKGESFGHLLREMLQGNAHFHYDRRAGKRGFVLSFERARTPIVSRLLPLVVPVVAQRQLVIVSLSAPVIEILLGNQHLLVAEDRGRVYVANGLESLLRVLDQPDVEQDESAEALTIAVRGEAYVDDLLRLFVGTNRWPAKLIFTPSAEADGPLRAELRLGPTKLLAHLGAEMPDGVLAAVPRGVAFAAAGSFALPPRPSLEDWARLGADGVSGVPSPAPPGGGVAMVWDVRSRADGPFGDVGLAIAFPKDGVPEFSLDEAADANAFSGDCGGGTVWLLASNEMLLNRMKESCERRSTSVLSSIEQGVLNADLKKSQLLVVADPGLFLEGCFRYGVEHRGGGETASEPAGGSGSPGSAPTWKQEYEQAVLRVSGEAESVFSMLPSAYFYGRGDASGARLSGIYSGSLAGRSGGKE